MRMYKCLVCPSVRSLTINSFIHNFTLQTQQHQQSFFSYNHSKCILQPSLSLSLPFSTSPAQTSVSIGTTSHENATPSVIPLFNSPRHATLISAVIVTVKKTVLR